MKPYYSHGGIEIYHGDCREILGGLPKADLLLTDPPYGIGADKRNAHSSIRDNDEWADATWDVLPDEATVSLILNSATWKIVWGGNYFGLPVSRCWLVWSKPERNFSLADAELAWTNFDAAVRVFDCPRNDGQQRVHPTQKPLALMQWAIGKAPDSETIIDPFAGSCSTLVAAKNAGRQAIGIEISEEYCEIGAKRLSQETLQFEPQKENPVEQMEISEGVDG